MAVALVLALAWAACGGDEDGADDAGAGADGAAGKDAAVVVDTRGRGGNAGRDGGGGAGGKDAGRADASKDSGDAAPDADVLDAFEGSDGGGDGGFGDGGSGDRPRDAGDAGPLPFALTSTAFKQGEMIPLTYRCMQQNISPPLRWTPGPVGTKSYAVILLQAGTPIRWQLWDIPPGITSLAMNVAKAAKPSQPPGSKQSKMEGATLFGYNGPCPPSTSPSTFVFVVYALKETILPGLMPMPVPKDVAAAIEANYLASTSLSVTGHQ